MSADRHARFEGLLADHAGIVGKIAGIYTRGPDDRRDLQQEIATQLWRAFDRYDERLGKFSTWMYRIALNVAISHLRRARTFEPLADDVVAAAPTERDDRADALYACIQAFEPLDRALVLLYLEDRSYGEIAEVLGISEANVATKLTRLRNRLRTQLTGASS
jgi:RNA polymerase sigma factor (sigma-70 family)